MSLQILAKGGLRDFCAVVFGEDDVAGETTSLDKLEYFSLTLNSPNAKISKKVGILSNYARTV
jgi:hypothetical protein